MYYPNIAEDEAASLQLKLGEWKPIPRVSKTVPFGYEVAEEDPDTLLPIPLELEALEQAKVYRDRGHSLRDVAEWVEQVTGRKISHTGLQKRIKSDSQRRAKAKTLRMWAARYQEAIQKAYRWDQKHTGYPTELYERLLDPEFNIGSIGRGIYDR